MTAEDLGWGPPGLSRTERVPCPGIQLNVRPAVAPLFAELVRWLTAERTRSGAPPLTSSGGYIKRLVRGSTSTWSNHSWGLAADFNAATNPMQRSLRTDMPPGTSEVARSLGMRWGGDYTGRKDPMHFEVVVGPDEAARLVAGLQRRTAALRTKPAITTPTVQEDDVYTLLETTDTKRLYALSSARLVHIPTMEGLVGMARCGAFSELDKAGNPTSRKVTQPDVDEAAAVLR